MKLPSPTSSFAFGPRNYRLMWIGVAVLAAGFITMKFGDKENYGEDFLGITLGPLLLVLGFIIEFAAIMVRDPSVHVMQTTAQAPLAASLESPTAPASGPAPAPAAPSAPAYKRL